uniref:Uncharacterized protein n=2 Tax=unclassified Candidatus Kentrum TaxID=2643149 RepID=A0A451ADN0_9GAMM|nr:MAG: hypothetical protein BECKLPF1236B_GA0070989_104024 [Candidatus Kentron sp. LPFa]VFK64113.1 MAG: hypothetical protein BECKUNK1418G_GA0071005_104127 [Candidatus Kentron sp. UNK]VFK68908.1 MAG: hypothetical protein BECKUNK1418H_GA0071006_10081 [Candidatus Kentron sp. UNK]
MGKAISFNELLEAVDHLSPDEQDSLIDVVRHRITEHRRQEISALISSARKEYQQGKLCPETPQDIMNSILL